MGEQDISWFFSFSKYVNLCYKPGILLLQIHNNITKDDFGTCWYLYVYNWI